MPYERTPRRQASGIQPSASATRFGFSGDTINLIATFDAGESRNAAFAKRVSNADDGEVLGLLFKYAEIADRVAPDLIATRLPMLVEEAEKRAVWSRRIDPRTPTTSTTA